MNRSAIASAFVEEPVHIGSVELYSKDGSIYQKDIIISTISFGCLERICSYIDPHSPLLRTAGACDTENKVKSISGDLLVDSLFDLAKVIVVAHQNSPKFLDSDLVDAVYTQFTPKQILEAVAVIINKTSFKELNNFYQFKPSKDKSEYPGANSPWSLIANSLVSFKGCNEHDLKWGMSYVNLLMYCSTLSASRSTTENKKPAEGEAVDMFSFFDKQVSE